MRVLALAASWKTVGLEWYKMFGLGSLGSVQKGLRTLGPSIRDLDNGVF